MRAIATGVALVMVSCTPASPPGPHGADPGDADLDGGDSGDPGDPGDPGDGGDASFDCQSCHGSAGNPAPPLDTQGRASTTFLTVGAHRSHLRSGSRYRTGVCADCHLVPSAQEDAGHIDPSPAELLWGEVAQADQVTPSYDGSTCSVYCHGVSLHGGANPTPTWTRVGNGPPCGSCHGIPPPVGHVGVGFDCTGCHPFSGLTPLDPERHVNGTLDVDVTCGACHDLPPATGAHATHAALAAPVYGGLGTAADLTGGAGYAYGCGHCHPLDPSRHMNGGSAEVELFDANAPLGSLKAQNPASASYSLGACSNVYCHSGMATTSGPVPWPGRDFPFTDYPVAYPDYPLARTRVYRAIGWDDGPRACGDCHGFPPRGESPAVSAGAGESHAFLRDDGYEDLHIFNHGFEPVLCRTCHYDTVQALGTYTRDAMGVTTLDDVAVGGYAHHVNGDIDVVFDVAHGFVYDTSGGARSMDLSTAAYDGATRTCTNVACHYEQTAVAFGTPYRPESSVECNICHRF